MSRTTEVGTMNKMLMLAILPFTFNANATCVTGPPEIGDIGPSFERVCDELERRFPGAALAVEDLDIHSPMEVSVIASVDSRSIPMRYTLEGFSWILDDTGVRTAGLAVPPPAGPVPAK
jgi:hypothetical protein